MILEESALHELIDQQLLAVYFTLTWSILALFYVWQNGLIKRLPPVAYSPIRWFDVLFGFAFYFISQIIFSALIATVYYIATGKEIQADHLSEFQRVSVNLLVVFSGFLALIIFYFYQLTEEKKRAIFGDKSQIWYQQYLIGACSWFFIFPLVTLGGSLVRMFTLMYFKEAPAEQLAVEQVLLSASHPVLLVIMSIAVFVLVPIAEEFLFRGLLQSWFKMKFKSPFWGIIATSVVFAAFHFTRSQGVTNIELLSSLFFLSCFLGYLYERQRSLWTSIGLHSLFNAATLLFLFKES